MTYAAIAAAVIGAGASVGGSLIAANNQPSPGGGGMNPQTLLGLEAQFRPAAYSSGLSGLEAQNAYGIGASPDQLALEIISRQIEQASNANVARKFQKFYSNVQSYNLAKKNGQPISAQQVKVYNESLAKLNKILGARGAGAYYNEDTGQLVVADPAQQQQIDAARANYSAIQANRLSGQQQLSNLAANYPVATADQIQQWQDQYAKQITGEINNTYDLQLQNLLQSANTQGYNPAGAVGLLQQQQSRDLLAVPQTAAARALQLIGGQQGLANNSIAGINAALSPDQTIAIMNALRGQQTPTTGQLAAAQIGANTSMANTAANNNTSSINGAAGNVGDYSTLIGMLLRGMSSGSSGNTTANSMFGGGANSFVSSGFGPGT